MKLKTFFDVDGDPVTVDADGLFVSLRCTEKLAGETRSAMACMDANTAEAVGLRLLKAARKLRKVESDGEE